MLAYIVPGLVHIDNIRRFKLYFIMNVVIVLVEITVSFAITLLSVEKK